MDSGYELEVPFVKVVMSFNNRRRNRSHARCLYYQSVIKIDGRCMNMECSNPNGSLQAHHIIYRSHGGADHLCNGITLCMLCHHRVHQGFTDLASGRVTGSKYMITILEQWHGTPTWRWDTAYNYLQIRT